jgi:hypothetical protein
MGWIFNKSGVLYIYLFNTVEVFTMVATSSLWQVIHNQDYKGQVVQNVYFYRRAVGAGVSFNLAADWVEVILPLVNALQSSNVHNTNLLVQNMGDLSDFDEFTLTTSGLLEAEAMPIFNAVSYTFKPNTRAVRHGGKRIAGIPEAEATEGVITNSGYLTAMQNLKAAYAANLVGAEDTWEPVLIKRIKTAISGTTPVKYRYTLPGVGDDATVAGILAVSVSNLVKHQTSRQPV